MAFGGDGAAFGADQVSPAGGVAAGGGLGRGPVAEQPGENRGLAVVDVPGGSQQDPPSAPDAIMRLAGAPRAVRVRTLVPAPRVQRGPR